ncbi:MAG: hypothetical protein KDM64_11025, partial [Verrucomicrobiae bacterium]|nr:hypothetical protein [Verrucomicrobiae bacterium]
MSPSRRILWVKSGPLHPLNTGGRRRTHAMLTELSRHHEVTWLAGLSDDTSLAPEEESDPYAKEKIWISTRESKKGSPAYIFDLFRNLIFSSLPYVLDRYRSKAMEEAIRAHDASG